MLSIDYCNTKSLGIMNIFIIEFIDFNVILPELKNKL